MPIIPIPKTLRDKLGEEASNSLVELLNIFGGDTKEQVMDQSSTRFEKTLTTEISGLRIELIEQNTVTREEFNLRITDTREELVERIAATREELLRKIAETREELLEKINETREELLEKINETREELLEMIHDTKTSMIKWMFIFWIGQIGAIVGILFAFFK
jgi:translation elongation factor EF-G